MGSAASSAPLSPATPAPRPDPKTMSPSIPPSPRGNSAPPFTGAGKGEHKPQALDSSSVKANAPFFFFFPRELPIWRGLFGSDTESCTRPGIKGAVCGVDGMKLRGYFLPSVSWNGCLLGLPLPALDGSQAHKPHGRRFGCEVPYIGPLGQAWQGRGNHGAPKP